MRGAVTVGSPHPCLYAESAGISAGALPDAGPDSGLRSRESGRSGGESKRRCVVPDMRIACACNGSIGKGSARVLGIGLGWRPQTAGLALERTDLGFVEVISESVPLDAPLPIGIQLLPEQGTTVIPHGVSLGLGGPTGRASRASNERHPGRVDIGVLGQFDGSRRPHHQPLHRRGRAEIPGDHPPLHRG